MQTAPSSSSPCAGSAIAWAGRGDISRPMPHATWTARTILKELADPDRRRAILAAFWKHGEQHARLMAQMHLAKALHFRDETIRKMPSEKKADLLASRIGVPEFDQFLEMALMAYHTHHANTMMGAFLDRWGVPHNNGSIEAE